MKTVAVDPDMRFYNLLESYPYTPTTALCEFIDNSIQAFEDARQDGSITDGEKLEIHIKFKDEELGEPSIVIRDYGVGIAETDLQQALKPAFAQKDKALSEFGIGMKASAIWFGRRWQLTSLSRVKGEQFCIEFDLDHLLSNGLSELQVNEAGRLKKPGVEIKISKLKNKIYKRIVEDTHLNLQEIYQLFTRGEGAFLKITTEFNGTRITKSNKQKSDFYEVLRYPRAEERVEPKTKEKIFYSYGETLFWKEHFDFKFNGKKVHGFLSVLKTSSQKSNPGIRLFRFKRLIRGMVHAPYRPVDLVGTANKHAASRVYGEIHLDGQPISNHKGDFQFDEAFFLETLKNQPQISALIDQAESYRAKLVEKGKTQHFGSFEDFQKATNKKTTRRTSPAKKKKGKTSKPGSSPKFTSASPQTSLQKPIDALVNASLPSQLFLLHQIRDVTVEMYHLSQWWPFCLCYRVVLEVGIIEKLKQEHEAHYEKAYDKSIEGLLKYLSTHRKELIDEAKFKVLHKNLRDGGKIIENIPMIAVLNNASHGNFRPSETEVDILLTNTQALIEWISE
nr:ATP-binding protein [uncultured Pseudodesulfovibrio sp.]